MRPFALALMLSFVLPLAAQAAGKGEKLAPEAFVGTYDLVKEKIGMVCEPRMQGLLSHSLANDGGKYIEIDLGTFAFTAVNLGAQSLEDEVASDTTNSYTTSDSIVFESQSYNKANGEQDTEKTVATLNGTTLHIVSRSAFTYHDGYQGETEADCVYKKISDNN